MPRRIFSYLLCGLSAVLLSACAVQSTPEGGDKDVTPPTIVKTVPENRSTHFIASRIAIEFDEYVRIDGFSSQFISSPPLKHKVDYSLRGKVMVLTLEDTLRPNTTYTFSFGNSIKDITENNPQTDFKYVFSTGAVLDSQRVSGTVIDAYSTRTQEAIMVALYNSDSEDSVFVKDAPLYYSLSDENGNYSIDNVAPGSYKIIAVNDKDFDYQWSGAAEALGFIDGVIHSDENPELTIPIFRTAPEYKFYRGKYNGFGKIEMYFSIPVPDVHIERIDTAGSTSVIERPENGDTIVLWTTFWKNGDYGEWIVRNDGFSSDTMRIKFLEKDTVKEKVAWLKTPPFSVSDSLVASSLTPIASIDLSKMSLVQFDSVQIPFEVKQSAPRNLTLKTKVSYGDRMTWILDSGAVTTIYGTTNDSTALSFKMLKDNDLAIFHMRVNTQDPTAKVIELFNDQGTLVYRTSFTQSVQIDLFDVVPQKLKARVIYDENQNGKWDTGDYFTRRYPERVIYLEKDIELRANWEIEETWNIQESHH